MYSIIPPPHLTHQTYPSPYLSALCLPSASGNEMPTWLLASRFYPTLILNFPLSLLHEIFPLCWTFSSTPWATASSFKKSLSLTLHTTLPTCPFLFSLVIGKKKRIFNSVECCWEVNSPQDLDHWESTYSSLSPFPHLLLSPASPTDLLPLHSTETTLVMVPRNPICHKPVDP